MAAKGKAKNRLPLNPDSLDYFILLCPLCLRTIVVKGMDLYRYYVACVLCLHRCTPVPS